MPDPAKAAAKPLTFEAFRRTGEDRDIVAGDDSDSPKFPGRIYYGGAYLEKVAPPTRGQWLLTVGRDTIETNDLELADFHLWRWVRDHSGAYEKGECDAAH